MANKFIAGVANISAFVGSELVLTAKTLLDSTFSISNTAEEVRGGQGNQLLGKYYHDSALNITLTDVLFNMQYLALQTGSSVVQGSNLTDIETVVITSNSGTLVGTALNDEAWVALPNTDAWTHVTVANNVFTYAAADSTSVCVKYFKYDLDAEYIKITSDMIPSEVRLIMTANEYRAGSSTDLTDAVRVGIVEFDIPRFQFNGNMDLAMTSSGVANSPLEGSALATFDASCTSVSGYYALITEKLIGYSVVADLALLAVDSGDGVPVASGGTTTLVVYGIKTSGTSAFIVPNSNFTFTTDDAAIATVGTTSGIVTGVTAGTCTISIVLTADTTVNASVVAVVS